VKKVYIPTKEQIIAINKLVCTKGGNKHFCYDPGKIGSNALAEIIDACAASRIGKDELIDWFDTHKAIANIR
jgi:hypothetical protein